MSIFAKRENKIFFYTCTKLEKKTRLEYFDKRKLYFRLMFYAQKKLKI